MNTFSVTRIRRWLSRGDQLYTSAGDWNKIFQPYHWIIIMIKILIYAALAYIAYALVKNTRLVSKSNHGSIKEKGSYKNLNIKDAEFEDIQKKDK